MTTPKQQPTLTQNPPRRRVKLHCPEVSITEPDTNNAFSMKSIAERLKKGQYVAGATDAVYSLEPLRYTNLQDALNFTTEVTKLFESLPSDLRKLMGNDISQFESFVANPDNKQHLIDHGLLIQRDSTNLDVLNELKELNTTLKAQSPTPTNKA